MVFWEVWEGSLDHLGPRLFFEKGGGGHLAVSLRFLMGFWEVKRKLNQNGARKGKKNMRVSAKIHQNYATLSKN